MLNTQLLRLAGLAVCLAVLMTGAEAAPRVSVTIKPLHALVAGVMERAGEPELIWSGAVSPHGAQLRPSQVHMIENADVIFHIGGGLELALADTLERRKAAGARVLALVDIDSLKVYPVREGGIWAGHEHHEEDAHEAGGGHNHNHDSGGGEAAVASDPHIWLDPQNAKAMTLVIAEVLAAADPENAEQYRANASGMIIGLNALGREIGAALRAVRNRPYVVFHDGYQYFEKRFGLNGVGAITVDPERAPGAKRLKTIRTEIVERGAVCVFAEPQFEVGYVEAVSEGSDVRTATLDPLGVSTPSGKEAYAAILWAMTKSIAGCLAPGPQDQPDGQ